MTESSTYQNAHINLISRCNTAFKDRASALGVQTEDIANHMVGLWTNGQTKGYMAWFQDKTFDHVLKPDDLVTDDMSAQEIEEAVRDARIKTMGEWVDKIATITLDGTEPEVSIADTEPEEEPEKPEPKATPDIPTVTSDDDDDIDAEVADAIAVYKKKKKVSPPVDLGPLTDRVDGLAAQFDTLVEAVSVLSKKLARSEKRVSALLKAITGE